MLLEKNGVKYDCPEQYINTFIADGWEESKKATKSFEGRKKQEVENGENQGFDL